MLCYAVLGKQLINLPLNQPNSYGFCVILILLYHKVQLWHTEWEDETPNFRTSSVNTTYTFIHTIYRQVGHWTLCVT